MKATPQQPLLWIMLVIGITAALLLRGQATALMQSAAASSGGQVSEGEIEQGLLAKVQAEGTISVIVGLSIPFSPQNDDDEAQQANIDTQRGILIAITAGVGSVQIVSQSDRWAIPFVALDVDEAAYRSLLNSPMVSSIRENLAYAPTLTSTIPIIDADQVWAASFTGTGQTVAILDTGVDGTHPAFAGRIAAEACFSGASGSTTLCPNLAKTQTGSGAASPARCESLFTGDDSCYHGTHVAGIAAGADGSRAIYGVARGSNLIVLQVFSKIAGQPSARTYASDYISGLNYIYGLRSTYSIAAVTMSFGGGSFASACDGFDPALTTMLGNLRAAGIMPVTSAGNDGSTTGIGYPACISNSISVSSTTDLDARSPFANTLPSLTSLFAPGSSVYAAVPPGSFLDDGTGYATLQGTSMAVPHVAGAFALLRSAMPGATSEQILTALRDTGVPIPVPGGTIPRINVLLAYYQLTGAPTPTATPVTYTLTGQIGLQGRPAAPHAEWVVPLDVVIEPVSGGAAVFDGTVTTNTSGSFTISGIPAGIYTVWVKHDHTLARAEDVTVSGDTSQDFGVLLEGDADNSNSVVLTDFSLLASSFNKALGQAGYDARADFNSDDQVNLTDFSLLASNFGQAGEEP